MFYFLITINEVKQMYFNCGEGLSVISIELDIYIVTGINL